MRQYIHVTKETREFLSKAFDIEPRTVYNALNFVKDNDLAKRVRKLAYEKGGILMMGTFHPAALLRNPNQKPAAMEDLLALRDKIREVCPEVYEL